MKGSGSFLLFLILAGSAFAQFEPAQAKLSEYRQTYQAYLEAVAQNDPQAMEERLRASESLLAESRALFEAAGVLESESAPALAEYASALEAAKDYDLAAEALQQAILRAPEQAELWVGLGRNLAQVGPAGKEEAFEILRRALELEPAAGPAAEAHFVLGKLYHGLGLPEEAATEYARALDFEPGHVEATIGQAVLRARLGEVKEAEQMLRDLGRAAQPYDAQTRVMLRHALQDLQGLGLLLPDDFDTHVAYSRLLYRAARFQDAILAAQRAVAVNPQAYEVLNFIGTMQLQAGNAPQAREAFEQSLAVNPDQPEIAEGVKTLPKEEQPAPAPAAPPAQAPSGEGAPPALLQRPGE